MNCRRGFICRMRLGHLESLHRLRNRRPIFNHNGQHYAVMHCTGYVKTQLLVAIGRLQIASMPLGNGQSDLGGNARSFLNTNQFSMRWLRMAKSLMWTNEPANYFPRLQTNFGRFLVAISTRSG
uniref:Uncharacterized protein n=1 Tax=Ditylenchus dipsaci TaxID=166011 RepID=A0A915ECS2_9BILA